MAKSNYMTTISIDTNNSLFHFYSMVGNDKKTIRHRRKSYAAKKLDENFFYKFNAALKDFSARTPSESIRKVSIILPDSMVLTDTIRVPTIKGVGQTQKMLDVTLGGLYSNYDDLQISAHIVAQNKQYSTIAIAAVQKKFISSIYAACSENKMLVDTLSFASAGRVTAATVLNPKLKNASYLFLDIKDIYSHFSFVVDGKVIGYYSLPFGLEFLRSPQVISEDMLFDHSYAELTVLNAKERAQSQTLSTMPTFENVLSDNAAGSEEGGNVSADQNDSDELSIQKIFFNKTPRNLPKFMRRDVPDTEDAIAYENFRIFVKWALSLIQNNEKITIIRKPEFVCVNLPSNLAYVLDMANAESKENGIMFTRLSVPDDDPIIASSLELYGGLFPSQINPGNKF